MNLTAKLKAWLVSNCGVAATATDPEFRQAAAKAMSLAATEKGYLSPEEVKALTAADPALPPAPPPAPANTPPPSENPTNPLIKQIADGQAALAESVRSLADTVAKMTKPAEPAPAPPPNTPPANVPPAPAPAPERSADPYDGLPVRASSRVQRFLSGQSVASGDPKHKPAHTQYEGTTKAAVFPDTDARGRPHFAKGRPVQEFMHEYQNSRTFDEPSELQKAISGAWIKFCISDGGTKAAGMPSLEMTEHDWELVKYALESCKWSGVLRAGREAGAEAVNSISVLDRKLDGGLGGMEVKNLLDDAASGGLEISPPFFDDSIIMTPLLYGELYPLVEVVNITRGRRIEGATIGNLTMAWGGADDSTIALFNTAAFIAAMDTTIHAIVGAVRLGLDFQSDTPIPIANVVTEQFGRRLLQQLDEQIALGDGVTEPEGIMVHAGVTSVAFGSAAPTLGAYEQLMFAVPKEFKTGVAKNRIVFAANEVSYQRMMSMAVTGTDQRRLLSYLVSATNSYADYVGPGGYPHAIVHAMANTQAFYANMAWYRMYRRAGIAIRRSVEGQTLMLDNAMLITARARFGGQLTHSSAAARSTTLQP